MIRLSQSETEQTGRLTQFDATDQRTKDKPPLTNDSPVAIYLRQIRCFSLIDREQEQEVAQRMAKARAKYRRLVLSTDYALNQAWQLLQAAHDQTERLDRIVDLAVRDAAKKQRIKRAIKQRLPLITRLLEDNRREAEAISRCQDVGCAAQGRRRLRARRRQAAEFIEEVCIRTVHFETWWQVISANETLLTPRRLQRIRSVRSKYLQAKRELASHNLRLVVAVAKRYRHHGLTFSDLVQEGNTGLLIAAEKFDGTLGHRFSTYATWWIMQMIRKAILNHGRVIRMPVAAVERAEQAQLQAHQWQQRFGRQLTQEEAEQAAAVTNEETQWMSRAALSVVSLDQPFAHREDSWAGESLKQHRELLPPDKANRDDLRNILLDVLSRWEPREREIIKLRYGLGNLKTHTLEEVGLALSLSRERVRQLEKASLQRLREQLAFIQHSLA
jgi:RNA polymerase primary sigma factor